MKTIRCLTFSAVALTSGVVSFPALSDTVLQVSAWGGPNHEVNTHMWTTWSKWVEEATDGRVTVNVTHDMGPPGSQMAMVADGIADVGYFFHGYNPGRFELTKFPELPTFKDYSSEVASAAYWHTYNKYFQDANEHRSVKPLALTLHGPGALLMKEPIDGLDNLSGKRIRVGGGVMADVAEALDITGVALPPTGVYEAASQGVIDGAMFPIGALSSYRLAEVLPYSYEVPGGFYRGSFAIVINPTTWESLSEENREAIMSVSGEQLSRLHGYVMDEFSDASAYEFGAENDNTFTELGGDDLTFLKERTAGLTAEWTQMVEDSYGINGQEVLNFYKAQLGKEAEEDSVGPRVTQE